MKILLSTHDHLGDAVALTAALYSAKRAFPDMSFDYEGRYPEVFVQNQDITPFDHDGRDVHRIKVTYDPFSQRRGEGGNLCEGYTRNLAMTLAPLVGGRVFACVRTTPVLYLNDDSRENKLGKYCVINANFQKCSETKAYPHWQKIVDACPNIRFVQVGGNEERDVTTDLRGVLDLRGETSVRQLISLVANACYVVSPPSAVIHIAAAFKYPTAFVLSGAREPKALTAYSNARHFTSVCDKYDENHGCMTFFTHGYKKACNHRTAFEEGGREYPWCMCDISPKEVARCLI